jgi:hypothetical protein
VSGYGVHRDLIAIGNDMDAPWRRHAACDGLWWLMEEPDLERHAKKVCASCPVWRDCRAWGLTLTPAEDTTIVIGGLTEKERTRLRKPRRASKPKPPPDPDDVKQCRRCQQTKPAAEFYRHLQTADGLTATCRACQNDAARRRRSRAAS